ncbi:hypothetical protein J3458_004520 [Metarhizium acridum]|uniref:uncharacterized protein n=1 Tax=Metarhizium acridum TaxID=92637 RepID=UPI001C6B1F38|nr:hypothetical protein J3458_004520 [Metarhizium acridum]
MAVHHFENDPSVPDTLGKREGQECDSTGEAVEIGFNNLESKLDTYFGQVFGWFKRQDASQATVDRLKSQKADYEARVCSLQDQLNRYKDKNWTLRNEAEKLRRMYCESQDEVDKLKEEKTRLRNVILKQTGTEKISDEEIKKIFTSIRQKIQAFAHSKAFCLEWNVSVPSPCHHELHKFWDTWNHLSLADRAFAMRGRIFTLVVDHILGQNLFGIRPTNHHDLQQIESSLQALEAFISSCKG